MKFVIEGTFVVDSETLENVAQVERIGGWGDNTYEVKGEPKQVTCVPDGNLKDGDQAEQVKEKQSAKELVRVKEELTTAKQKLARGAAVVRIKQVMDDMAIDIDPEELEEYLTSITSVWDLERTEYEDYLKWSREKEEREDS